MPIHKSVKISWALDGVSNPEMRIFVQGQGNQAFVRRRSWLRRTNKRVLSQERNDSIFNFGLSGLGIGSNNLALKGSDFFREQGGWWRENNAAHRLWLEATPTFLKSTWERLPAAMLFKG